MWFVPDEMTLKRNVDAQTGRATIVFDQATVALKTENFLQGCRKVRSPSLLPIISTNTTGNLPGGTFR